LPEANWFASRRHGVLVGLCIVTRFSFGWRNISDWFEQAPIVEPVDPFERGKFHGFRAAPGAASVDHLGLKQAVDGISESIVIAVTNAANRRQYLRRKSWRSDRGEHGRRLT
jgi:hypothetical protein